MKMPKFGPWSATPAGMAYSVLGTGASYLVGAAGMKMLAEWLLGGNPVPKGESGYRIDQEFVRKKNLRGQPTSQMIPNPDYDPTYTPDSVDADGALTDSEIEALDLGSVSDVVTTPGGAIDNQMMENAAMTVINNSTINNAMAASNVDQSSSSSGNGGGNGSSSNPFAKWNQLPFGFAAGL